MKRLHIYLPCKRAVQSLKTGFYNEGAADSAVEVVTASRVSEFPIGIDRANIELVLVNHAGGR